MTIRFDSERVRPSARSGETCPACGRGIDTTGLARPGDVVTAHLRYSCRRRAPAPSG